MLVYSFDFLKINSNQFGMIYMEQKNSKAHSHSFLEIAYIAEGECEHVLNGRKKTLKKGDYFIIDYNSVHQYFSKDDKSIKLINCLFVPTVIDSSLKDCNSFKNLVSSYQIGINYKALKFDPSDYVFHDDTGFVYELFMMMLSEYNKQQKGYMDIIRHSLSQIIILTLRQIYNNSYDKRSDLADLMATEISKRYSENSLLKAISDETHYTVPYLSQKFKKDMGISFKEFQTNVRIDKACRLLASTNKKITEIAEMVGYKDTPFFISVFKEKTNLTPAKFRKIAAGRE